MPFVYREKIANIDRSSKRIDSEVNGLVIKSINDILIFNKGLKFPSNTYIQILPFKTKDLRIKDVAHMNFLALHATTNGLTWYEIEYWLDELCDKFYIDGTFPFHRERNLRLYFDFRRMLYKIPNNCYSTSISCRRDYAEGIIS